MAVATCLVLLFLVFPLHFSSCGANLPPAVAGPRWPTIFEAPDFHINIAKRDIERVFKGDDNTPGPRLPTIFEAPGFHLDIAKRGVEGIFKGNDSAPGPRWPTIFKAPGFHLNIAADDIMNECGDSISTAEAWIAQAQEHIERDPVGTIFRAAWDVAGRVVMVAPWPIWWPPLNLLGFAGGIGPGTLASYMHSIIGTVARRSVFSILQSAGTGGYGAGIMDTLVRTGMLVKELPGILFRMGVSLDRSKGSSDPENDPESGFDGSM
ncbi:hypothetical protein GGS24DRAFT_507946 [Hypoxylon argillaceum]|nr:hypothetical protein GGS24DRAFT_507946 [Hypoxylon argillaceum]